MGRAFRMPKGRLASELSTVGGTAGRAGETPAPLLGGSWGIMFSLATKRGAAWSYLLLPWSLQDLAECAFVRLDLNPGGRFGPGRVRLRAVLRLGLRGLLRDGKGRRISRGWWGFARLTVSRLGSFPRYVPVLAAI